MARKINSREPRQPRTLVVGAGITEYWYLSHLKRLKGLTYVLQPSLFGDESMQTIQNRITEAVNSGASVICIFDEDVSQWNESEKRKMINIRRRYDNDSKVTIAGSMPSIEYWFLLHFENTNRYFGTSAKVIETLRKYLTNFDKKEQYLRNEKWVVTMIADNRMDTAYERARKAGYSGQSYSDMWKAVDKMKEVAIR